MCCKRGLYLLPDGRWYVSAAHTEVDVEATLKSVRRVIDEHKRQLVRGKGYLNPP